MTAHGVNLAALYERHHDPDRLFSWYNFTDGLNGTEVGEGGQHLNIGDFYFQIVVANNIAVAAVTLYAWEWLSTLPDEIRLYTTHSFKSSRHVLLFILVRYGTLPSLILPAFSVWHNFRDDTQGCLVHQQLAICIVQLIVSIVFAWRTVAIWDHQRRIVVFFIAIVCIQFGASFGLLWFSEEKLLPNGSCMPVTPANGFNPLPIFYAIAFAYDLLTLLMSTLRLWKFSTLGRVQEDQLKIHWNDLSSSGRRVRARIQQSYKGMRASPLIHRLTYAGLIYFLVATSFNAVAFGLEISKNVHSKAVITLYAPLMCILCQRIILLDVKTIWGDLDKHSSDTTGTREQALIDRVLKERRMSWQGSEDSSVRSPQLNPPSPPSEKQHVTVNMDPASSPSGTLGFQDMLRYPTSPSHSASTFVEHIAQDSFPSHASTATSMSEQDRATALRFAGFPG